MNAAQDKQPITAPKKPGKHVIFLGAGASLGSGYPLADQLRLMLTSPRYLTNFLLNRFALPLSDYTGIFNSIRAHTERPEFKKALALFRDGAFATVDEFCLLVNDTHPNEVAIAKAYMRTVLAMIGPEWTFQSSDYIRFVQRLFADDLRTPREDITILTYNYDPYLEFLLHRAYHVRWSSSDPNWRLSIPAALLSGFADFPGRLSGDSGFALLKLHGTLSPIIHHANSHRSLFNLTAFLKEDNSVFLQALNENVSTPGPVVFPWELFNGDGSFKDSSACSWDFKTGWVSPGKESLHAIMTDIWTRAREDVQCATKVSFVGMAFHHYLKPGLRFLFKEKPNQFRVHVANPDFESCSFYNERKRLTITGDCSAARFYSALSKLCPGRLIETDPSRHALKTFNEFISLEMAPVL